MTALADLKKELWALGTLKKARASAWFFKTGSGQYGEGDVFIGVTVPEQRKIAKRYSNLPLSDIKRLLHFREHEFRLTALLILVRQYEIAHDARKRQIYNLYLRNTKWINNWDLVDSSAAYIVGPYLQERSKAPILRLAKSKSLWERRMAMLSTFHCIKQGKPGLALRVAKLLLNDPHDLIQKAVGWMLREVGNRLPTAEELFIRKYATVMPRTTLRYALEKFPEEKRKVYLAMRSRMGEILKLRR